ncbi:amidohydrolase family protein [Mesorhizobium sp. CAU 1741]|uniref:amidohydrolase family protein n=1 Tax=Mesorhizobium sp. CAU 1741 TaxID=3140366 RepID=UPI00325BAF69
MNRTLITNATLVTVDPELGIVPQGDILVEDGRIAAIGAGLADTVADAGIEVIDATGMIAIPGLINAHIHMWQTALRGFGVDWTGVEHHFHMQTEFVPVYTPDDIGASEYFGALNLLSGGTTTVYEWCHGNRTPDHNDAAIDGLQRSGIRSIFIHGTVKTLPLPGQPHFSQVPHPREEATRLRRRHNSDDGKLILALGVLGPEYSPLAVCEQDFRLAEELGVWSSAHAHGRNGHVEGGYIGLKKAGLLTARHNAVHLNSASDEELRALIDTGCSVTATSQTEINGGSREPLIRRVAEMGGTPSIGTDSEANTPADMMEAMRWSLVIQRLFNNLEKARKQTSEAPAATNAVSRDKPLPPRISPSTSDALFWATMGNAKAFGLDHRIGSLTVGKAADITLVRGNELNLAPAINPIDAIVSFANPSNVDTVLVAGEVMKRNGKLTQQAGVSAAAADLRRRAERVLTETGNTTGALM